MMIDTHVHLNDSRYSDKNIKEIVESATLVGVKKMINVCAEPDEFKAIIEQANMFDNVYASIGIHPHHANNVANEAYTDAKTFLANKKVVAVGEIGLDYHYDDRPSNEVQKEVFVNFLDLAREYNLPVIVHSRDAWEDTYKIISEYKDLTIVMHCFSYSAEIMEKFLQIGCYISFAGPVTYKNAKNLKEAAKKCPLDRILCETDCPWLPPTPHRGQMNYPEYVKYVYECISEIKELDITPHVHNNASRIFKI